MYFEFAITANERGRNVARLMERLGPLAGKKALDIGCAYGGFVVAFSEAGAEATGMDLDGSLLRLARLNLQDHQVAADLLQEDATSRETAEALRGQFDLVTCNDVIEHVEDPPALVRFIATVLRPGGLAYLEIPNRNLPAFVLRDGHYQLFGIVLLDRPEAERYYSLHAPGVRYSVGHYLELDGYRDLVSAAGLEFSVLPETLDGVTPEATLDGVRALREALPPALPAVPEELRHVVGTKISEYLETIECAPRTTPEERESFLLTYGPAFWKVLVRRAG
jgi:SAM-dependent methyltransferase